MDVKQTFDYFSGKKILYVHGFGSSGASHTPTLLAQKMPEAIILHPDIPLEPTEMLPFLEELCEREQPDLIIGTSMGGMLVEKLRGYDRICINPALHMENSVGTSIKYGEQPIFSPREDGVTKIQVTKALGKAFGEVCARNFEGWTPEDARRVTGLFGNQDPIVHTHDEFKAHYPLSTYFEGEHRLTDNVVMHVLLPVIRRYWVKQAGLNPKVIFVDIDALRAENGKQRESARIAYETLQKDYDVFTVTPTDEHPQNWLFDNIGIGPWQRLVLTDHAHILMGDYYITRRETIADEFIGTTLLHGGTQFKQWDDLLDFFDKLSGQ